MQQSIHLSFTNLPHMLRLYPAIALRRKRRIMQKGETFPHIVSHLDELHLPIHKIERLNMLFHREPQERSLFITYPHILLTPLRIATLTHREFPVSVIGMIHTSESIACHRPIEPNETLRATCSTGEHFSTARGDNFIMTTTLHAGGELVWEERCTFLSRERGTGQARNGTTPVPEEALTPLRSWDAPHDIGRRFARVTGDINPIHLSRYTARPFGFKRAIAHGAWTLTRTVSELEHHAHASPRLLRCDFKRPLLLPGRVRLEAGTGEGARAFSLVSVRDEKHILMGEICFSTPPHLGD